MDILVIVAKLLLTFAMSTVVVTLAEPQAAFQKSAITNVNVKMVSLVRPAQIMKFQRILVKKIIPATMAASVSISHIAAKTPKNVFVNR